jgi:AcrR family transcriptional regulator
MRKRDESKISKIQDATAQIILTEGAPAVSTVKVARQVGISQSNVYLYFKNKKELLLSVYQRELAAIRTKGQLERISDASIDIRLRLRDYIHAVYTYAMAHPDSLTLIQQIKFLLKQYDANPFMRDDDAGNIVTQLLQSAMADGVIKPLPVNMHMSLVFSVIHTHTRNIQSGQYAADAYTFEQIYAFIWDAMRVQAPPMEVTTLDGVTDDVLDRLMDIWLNSNLEAHDFVAPEYWRQAEPAVRAELPGAELTVATVSGAIAGFAGVQGDYVAGLFVARDYRDQGLGGAIMRTLQDTHARLRLSVYERNTGAVRFYERLGFTVTAQAVDSDTKQVEYEMSWHA